MTELVSSKVVFASLQQRARQIVNKEPLLSKLLSYMILDCEDFSESLARLISTLLATVTVTKDDLLEICHEAYLKDPSIVESAAIDLQAVCQRDPAVEVDYTIPFLYFKGPHALESYRIAHWLYQSGRHELALYMQSVISHVLSVDIHPEAKIGRGIMLDHATGLVIGQTAVVADNVSIMQDVTLGGTGKESGDRHPKISEGVLIGAGAKVLGNIKVGIGAKIGAGSVVLKDVLAHTTVAGIPARVVGKCHENMPSLNMDQEIETDSLCTQACAINFLHK